MLQLAHAEGVQHSLSFHDLTGIDSQHQVLDVRTLGAKREGGAVRLSAVLEWAGVSQRDGYIGLHSSRDNFHASIPLTPIRERALLIYQLNGQPLPESAGGPIRFFIPDHAACHTHEIDECANVKYVDRIELTPERGYDNRPTEDEAHAELHRRQVEGQ